MPGFVGRHEENSLPVSPGQTVTIPKGVTVRSFNPSHRERVTTRQQTVRVDHLLGGMDTRCLHVAEWDRAGRYPGQQDVFAFYDLVEEACGAETDPERRRKLYDLLADIRVPIANPEVRWVGRGGYWCWVDINDLLGLSKDQDDGMARLLEILGETRH